MKKRRSVEERIAAGEESLTRAVTTVASNNDNVVIQAFAARGIHATPRVDVFTYQGWYALGRQVRRGERSVRCTVWVPVADRNNPTGPARVIPRTACVFHLSQTDPIEGRADRSADIARTRADSVQFAEALGAIV